MLGEKIGVTVPKTKAAVPSWFLNLSVRTADAQYKKQKAGISSCFSNFFVGGTVPKKDGSRKMITVASALISTSWT